MSVLLLGQPKNLEGKKENYVLSYTWRVYIILMG